MISLNEAVQAAIDDIEKQTGRTLSAEELRHVTLAFHHGVMRGLQESKHINEQIKQGFA